MARMGLSGIRYIYAARLGARAVLVQEGFAILGIAVGVALLLASQISATSLSRSETQLNTQLVGNAQLQLDARGPEGFAEGLLQQVRSVPGVQVALPILERQVNLTGPGGERSVDLIGVDLRLVHIGRRLPARFAGQRLAALPAIALPEPLALEVGAAGSLARVKLQIGARVAGTLVAATLREADLGGLVHNPIAIAPIGYAQGLARAPAQLSRIFVRYDPARAGTVRGALARLAAIWNVNLVAADFDSRLFAVAVAPQSKSEALFSGISALVGFMFALNAMLVTVPSRRRLVEDVRPHGATRWMTIQILLFDAAVLGVLGCVLGLVLGDILSIAVFHSTPGYLAFAFPIGSQRIVTWHSVALAVAAGLLAAIIGVLWPVRAIVARPLQPRAEQADPRRAWIAARLITGVLFLLITTFTLVADTHAAVVGNIALVAALVCLLPFLFDGLLSAFEHVSNRSDGVASALAVTELQSPQTRVRSLAIAATAAVAVFGVVEFQGVGTNLKRGLESSIRGMDSSAAIWVMPSGRSSLQSTIPFKAVDVAALARLPGVRRLGTYRGSFLDWGERRLWVLAPAGDVEHLLAGPARERRSEARLSARPSGWLGAALTGARLRTPPARRPGVHAALTTTADPAGGRFDDEPRMATGRDRAQLQQLCASLGEQRPERIRDPDHAGRLARDCGQSGSQRLEIRPRSGCGKRSRTRAASLRRDGSGALAADADPSACADRRGARAGRGDRRDDLAAARAHRIAEV